MKNMAPKINKGEMRTCSNFCQHETLFSNAHFHWSVIDERNQALAMVLLKNDQNLHRVI